MWLVISTVLEKLKAFSRLQGQSNTVKSGNSSEMVQDRLCYYIPLIENNKWPIK